MGRNRKQWTSWTCPRCNNERKVVCVFEDSMSSYEGVAEVADYVPVVGTTVRVGGGVGKLLSGNTEGAKSEFKGAAWNLATDVAGYCTAGTSKIGTAVGNEMVKNGAGIIAAQTVVHTGEVVAARAAVDTAGAWVGPLSPLFTGFGKGDFLRSYYYTTRDVKSNVTDNGHVIEVTNDDRVRIRFQDNHDQCVPQHWVEKRK